MGRKKTKGASRNGAKHTGYPDGSYVDVDGNAFNADGSPMSAERAAELEITSTTATATAEKPAPVQVEQQADGTQKKRLPPEFSDDTFVVAARLGSVSFAKSRASVQAICDVSDWPGERRDQFLFGTVLDVTIRRLDDETQLRVFDDEPGIRGQIEVHKHQVGTEHVTFKAAFPVSTLDDRDKLTLIGMRTKAVRISARRIGSAAVDPESETRDIDFGDDGEDPDHAD